MQRYIYIDEFSNFKEFLLELNNYEKDKLTINLLVGKNGSGKSTFLDAMFQIATHNLKGMDFIDKKTVLKYSIKDNDKLTITNLSREESEYSLFKNKIEKPWSKVIRFYTGNTKRNSHLNTRSIIDINIDKSKWIFMALIFSGKLDLENTNNEISNKWKEVLQLISINNCNDIQQYVNPKVVWIETNCRNNNDKFSELLSDINIRNPHFSMPSPNNLLNTNDKEYYRHFWLLNNNSSHFVNKINSVESLLNFLEYSNNIENDNEIIFKDCGFIYSFGNKKDIPIFPDQFLSDGEHALINRYALLSILKDCIVNNIKEKFLILFDEPETHFNEFWKTEFLFFLEQTLKDCPHDVFIATHSAMLVTDAKKDEIHRLEKSGNRPFSYPTPINTFGVNVIDIGKALFQMESDIGRRSQTEIEEAIKKGDPDVLNKLLREVGPGEWRWKIRTAIKDIEHTNKCKNYAKKD